MAVGFFVWWHRGADKILKFVSKSLMQGKSNRSNQQRKSSRKAGKKSMKSGGNMVPNSPGQFRRMALVFPPRMLAKLKFIAYQSFNLAATTGVNYRWRPSAAFDVDPALGGTSMAGFAELAGFYSTYRVWASQIKATVSNPSTTLPITLIVVPLNADPTNAMTVPNIIASSEQPYAKSRETGLLGSPPVRITSQMTSQKIFGDPMALFDHNFTALVSTVPGNNWFWNVCVLAPNFVATAIQVFVEVEVDCEFYDRIFLPN